MGGNCFKDNIRVDKFEFNYLVNIKLSPILDSLKLKYTIIPYYKNKKDFGDIDVIINTKNNAFNKCKNYIVQNKLPHIILKKSNTINTQINNVQIDLCFYENKFYKSAINFYSYNDLGNFLGIMFNKLEFKLGWKGLFIRPFNNKNYDIIISKDYKLILSLLGYDDNDYLEFVTGFNNKEDIFKFVCRSKFYNRKMFDHSESNNCNKKRNQQRKMYSDFLEWISDNDPIDNFDYDDLKNNKIMNTFELNQKYFDEFLYKLSNHDKILKKLNKLKYKIDSDKKFSDCFRTTFTELKLQEIIKLNYGIDILDKKYLKIKGICYKIIKLKFKHLYINKLHLKLDINKFIKDSLKNTICLK